MTTLTELRAAVQAAPETTAGSPLTAVPGYPSYGYEKYAKAAGTFSAASYYARIDGDTTSDTIHVDDLAWLRGDTDTDIQVNADDVGGTTYFQQSAGADALWGAVTTDILTVGVDVVSLSMYDYGPVDLTAGDDYWSAHGIIAVPAGYAATSHLWDGPAAPGGSTSVPSDRVFASVWTPDGATQLAPIPRRKGVTWRDPLNGAGSGSLQVPSDDPAAAFLRARNIVKFWYAGAYRYAFRVQQPKDVVVDSNGDAARWLTVGGPGVMDMLNDAVLYPEYGLTRNAIDQRAFTFASAVGDWYVGSEWAAPLGVAWTADTTSRANHPTDWPDSSAQWIWDTNPEADDAPMKVVYFRATLTVASDTRACISATADNYFDLYLNGQQILTSNTDEPTNWRSTFQYTVDLPAGTYLLAARVINAERAWPTQLNPGAFICSVAVADSAGKPTSTVMLRSNTTDWLCRPEGTTPPAWRAAQILHTFITEAQLRGVTAVSALTMDFTPAADSAGTAWVDNVDRSFNIGVKGGDLAEQLCEQGIDIAVGADLVVRAWAQRGVDRSTGAGAVILRPALNLSGYQVDVDLKITTRLLVRTPTGWLEVAAANEGTDGRVEDLLSLGTAASDAQASAQASSTFDDVALPVSTFTGSCLPVAGATPYADFDNGDVVLAPDGLGAAVPLRVMSISVSENETGQVSFVPELYEA